MSDTWKLATCSYRDYLPDHGVPIATSVGRHPDFTAASEIAAFKPYGIFKAMDGSPLPARVHAYTARLDRLEGRIIDALDDLIHRHRGRTLVLLCWCDLPSVDGCHRRWAADWLHDRLHDRLGLHVPELGTLPPDGLFDATQLSHNAIASADTDAMQTSHNAIAGTETDAMQMRHNAINGEGR